MVPNRATHHRCLTGYEIGFLILHISKVTERLQREIETQKQPFADVLKIFAIFTGKRLC